MFVATLAWAFTSTCIAGDPEQHWSLTQAETIWHTRYTNCDKGYSVDLPPGVIAHASHPPNPNHGFLIKAGDPGTRLKVTFDDGRIVGVEDEYNAMLMPNAKAQLNWDIQQTSGAKVENEKAISFRGLPAAEATYHSVQHGNLRITHEVVVFRKADDLVYSLRLVTDPTHYSQDLALFKQIEVAFRTFPITNGDCVNR